MPRGSKNDFFENGHVAYQIDGNDEQNRVQVKFSPKGQNGDHVVRSKGQILIFSYKVSFKDFYTVFSQIKARKHIEQSLHFVAWVMPQG